MTKLELTQDEFDTMHESVSHYLLHCQEKIKIYQGQPMKQNYWMNELSLSSDLMEKLKGIEDGTTKE